ncbi:histidine phosphatase family protein [Lysobacter sp. GX 14042]|uniref:histidine phosphatase family protein n=1 Tax=Lysobacter sp. GX 14042 TaxID=2907155 RepID=UPI001F3A5D0B|nr:histidine phosphatase family protein [Lysobacter sp. GX 14042]MCE7033086.1 histidine phosphatase family protein [Lysobacter sp. GX 14042]
MILDLVRHASTGRAGHLDGRGDPPLLAQATDALGGACHALAWSRAITSPRIRALGTARALATPRDLPIEMDSDWAELDFGDWDGLRGSDIDPAALAAFHRDPVRHPPPDGEPWPAFQARIGSALAALARDCDAAPAGAAPVLVVSHAGVLRMALSLTCGFALPSLWALRIDYGTRLRLRVELGGDGLWGELIELRQP